MKDYVACLKPTDFQALLDDFASYATSYAKYKCYEKLDWGTWKEIQNKFAGKCVTISFDTWGDEVYIDTNDGQHLYFNTADKSFGSYLFDEYAEQLEAAYAKYYDYDGSERYVRKDSPYSNLKKDVENKKKENKEKENMKGFNFDFGPCTNDNVRMSMYGLAVQNNAGVWVSYNSKAGEIIDVDILNFDARKYMFKMPVAIKDIKKGDIVVHNRIPMFVVSIDNGITAVDVRAGEEKKIIPTTNMFGFNFVTKIVSMFDAVGQAPTPDAPFGNMLPFMLLGEDGGKDMDPMMLMLMMNSNGGMSTGFDMSNPMMLYFLMSKDGKNSDMLPFMMMMGMNGAQAPAAHTCNCGNAQ